MELLIKRNGREIESMTLSKGSYKIYFDNKLIKKVDVEEWKNRRRKRMLKSRYLIGIGILIGFVIGYGLYLRAEKNRFTLEKDVKWSQKVW